MKSVVATKEPAMVGDVRLDIVHVDGYRDESGDYVVLYWLASTDNDAKKYRYAGWGEAGFQCRDDKGNDYPHRKVRFQPAQGDVPRVVSAKFSPIYKARKEKGRDLRILFNNGDLTSEQAIADAIVISRPVRGANHLTVLFLGDRIDVRGDFVFSVPKELWETLFK